MSLKQSLADSVRDRITPAKTVGIARTSGSPAISTVIPAQSSGGSGLGMAKKSMMGGKGMGAKNGVGFPKKASMATGKSGIKGPTGMGKDVRGGMK